MAEVREGSGVAGFLNEFVHTHSSMGHEGLFFDASLRDDFTAAGFEVGLCEVRSYPWVFPDAEAMARYCVLMFGIDRATPDEVRQGIEKHLGYREARGICRNCAS